MVYIFRNLLGLLESAIMLITSTREINVQQPNVSSRAIHIINFEKKCQNFYYLIFIFETTHQSKHIMHENLNNIYTNSYNHTVTICHYFDNWLMNVLLCVIKNISINK